MTGPQAVRTALINAYRNCKLPDFASTPNEHGALDPGE